MEAGQQEIPLDIDYNQGDIDKALTRPQLNSGWYRGRVVDLQRSVSKNNHLMLKAKIAPIDGEGETGSPSVTNFVTLPLVNPNVEGHQAPNTFGIVHSYLLATDTQGEFKRFPRSIGNDEFETADGDVVSRGVALELKQEATKATFEGMKRLWADPALGVGAELYMKVGIKGDFNSVDAVAAEPPVDATVITDKSEFRA